MTKWRLYVKETRYTIFEVEAPTAEEGLQICLTQQEKATSAKGVIEAQLDHSEKIGSQENDPTVKALDGYNSLDKKYNTN